MSDLEFFFDPVCPWAWITSRWVTEVQQQRDYDVQWRFISLSILNENQAADWYTPDYKAGHLSGLQGLRVADALRLGDGNDAVAAFYTALGNGIHVRQEGKALRADTRAFAVTALKQAGLDLAYADHVDDDSHDAHIRSETELAQRRAGKDLGTPIVTFRPGQPDEGSFFGPVIASIPRGEAALKLWDAIELVATTSGLAELKRSLRDRPRFD